MKRLLLLSFVALGFTAAHAQYRQNLSAAFVNKQKATRTVDASALNTPIKDLTVNTHHTAAKTTSLQSRWYNHVDMMSRTTAQDINTLYDTNHASFFVMWQDSSVFYPGSTDGITWLSFGDVFVPQAAPYNDPGYYPSESLYLSSDNPYTLDSVSVSGFYDRTNTTYVDTLIFTFVNESDSGQFVYFGYGGSVAADHNIDTFATMLWPLSSYMTAPINQVKYTYTGNALSGPFQIKVPLDDAIFADSLSNGTHEISVAPNLSLEANAKVSLSVTFKSGTAYVPGTEVTDYNNFRLLSHEINPVATGGTGFEIYENGDLNISSALVKDSTNTNVNSTLGFYVPSIAFTEPYAAEVHDISYKISADTATHIGGVSVKDVATAFTATAFPNPANSTLNIPVSMKANGAVTVSLQNTMGQTIATQQLGKVAAGQKATATFNTAALASGVYFYTVEANGQRLTKRVSVAR